jgi:hypothetical protein
MYTPKPVVRFGFLLMSGCALMLACACQKNVEAPPTPTEPFEKIPKASTVTNNLTEVSGIASSRRHSGYLWVHEDSGTPPQITLLKNDGSHVKSVFINSAINVDWEEMALAKGPNAALDYIYLADIGDNLKARTDCVIYRFPEPALDTDTVQTVERIPFRYPDGMHDAEAILVDDQTKDIYILTKSDNPSNIYKLPYPQSTSATNQAVSVGQLGYGGVTASAISVDGKEIIVKTYTALSYFLRAGGESIEQSLKKAPVNLTYQLEPQGEAVTFAADNSGFFTLSEKAFSPTVNLYFYKRN